jgi:hypothetical protein
VLQSRTPLLLDRIERELLALNAQLDIRVTNSRPIVGAALVALDTLGGSAAAQERLRTELDAAAHKVELTAVPLSSVGITVNGGVHGRASSGRSDNG